MINSFIQMVNESADLSLNQEGLVDEMGIKRVERLAGSEMGPIRQSSIDRRQSQSARPQAKSYYELATELVKAFKQIKSTDITMYQPSRNERRYYPAFADQTFRELLNQTKNAAPSEDKFVHDFGKWRDLFSSTSAIYFATDDKSSFQRSHFPNDGIPSGLRGIGLGYKLYRALLRHVGYISSNRSGSNEKDKAWGSLLDQKLNPDGSVSVDDAHAIIGRSNWMAIDKQFPENSKIEVAQSFITDKIGVDNTQPDRFDIDDELLALMPNDFLVKLSPDYLQSLVSDNRLSERKFQEIESSRSEAERRERERRLQAEREARERRAQEEAEIRRRLAARLERFGAAPDEDWDIGDFIVVKTYLYDNTYDSLPIRRVVAHDGRNYIAVKISDSIAIDQGRITRQQANDTRSTSDKSAWVKINLDQIPNLDNVNLNSEEKAYVRSFMDPEQVRIRDERRAQEESERREAERRENEERARNRETFGSLPDTAAELKAAQTSRNNGSIREADLLKKFRDSYFTERMEIIVMGPQQRDSLRNSFGVPVFIAWTGSSRRPVPATLNTINNDPQSVKLTNAVTGFTIDAPFTGLGLMAYPLSEVTVNDKLRARAGTHYYISGHKNAFGILAKSDYGAVNTSSQKFIYVKAYGYGERSVSVRLDLLRKIGEPTEI